MRLGAAVVMLVTVNSQQLGDSTSILQSVFVLHLACAEAHHGAARMRGCRQRLQKVALQ
jgi:hypothetical protein